MKINRLILQNFMDRTLDIDTTKRIQVFFGENAVGKSAILDALYWLFMGNLPHRGLMLKKDVNVISNNANKTLKVQIETDDGVMSRTAKSQVQTSKLEFGDHVRATLLSPMRILAYEKGERQRLFSKMVQQEASGNDIESLLKAEGVADEYITWCQLDLENAQSEAISLRRENKRAVKELEGERERSGGETIVEIMGSKIDLKKILLERIEATLEKRLKEQRMSSRAAGSAGVLDNLKTTQEQSLHTRKSLIAEIDDLPEIDALSITLEQCEDQLDEIGNDLTANHTTNSSLQTKMKYLQADENKVCPTCSQSITGEAMKPILDKMVERLEELFKQGQEISDKKDEVIEKVAIAKSAYTDRVELGNRLDSQLTIIEVQIKNQGAKIVELTGKPTADTKSAVILADKIKAITELITLKKEYDKQAKDVSGRDRLVAEYEETIRQMNVIDDMLKPDGAIRTLSNKEVSNLTYDMELAESWNMDTLAVEPDGSINLFDRPIECASKSEKWKAAVLLAEMLARHQKFPWLFLDGVDMLVSQSSLAIACQRWTHFKSIFMNISKLTRPNASTSKSIEFWWVESDKVEKVA